MHDQFRTSESSLFWTFRPTLTNLGPPIQQRRRDGRLDTLLRWHIFSGDYHFLVEVKVWDQRWAYLPSFFRKSGIVAGCGYRLAEHGHPSSSYLLLFFPFPLSPISLWCKKRPPINLWSKNEKKKTFDQSAVQIKTFPFQHELGNKMNIRLPFSHSTLQLSKAQLPSNMPFDLTRSFSNL